MGKYKRGTVIKDESLYCHYPNGSKFKTYEGARPLLQIQETEEGTCLRVRQATSTGYADCKVKGVVNISYPSSLTKRGRVLNGGAICGTLDTTCHKVVFVEFR